MLSHLVHRRMGCRKNCKERSLAIPTSFLLQSHNCKELSHQLVVHRKRRIVSQKDSSAYLYNQDSTIQSWNEYIRNCLHLKEYGRCHSVYKDVKANRCHVTWDPGVGELKWENTTSTVVKLDFILDGETRRRQYHENMAEKILVPGSVQVVIWFGVGGGRSIIT